MIQVAMPVRGEQWQYKKEKKKKSTDNETKFTIPRLLQNGYMQFFG